MRGVDSRVMSRCVDSRMNVRYSLELIIRVPIVGPWMSLGRDSPVGSLEILARKNVLLRLERSGSRDLWGFDFGGDFEDFLLLIH